ncbi:MAG: hypothetical protein GY776_10140 [Alteromonas sp.]|nr:hypothetical protein [Alteromonas sp.]
MKIEFYNIETGEVLDKTETVDTYFVMNDEVYLADDAVACGATVYFDNFIKQRTSIGWRVVGNE